MAAGPGPAADAADYESTDVSLRGRLPVRRYPDGRPRKRRRARCRCRRLRRQGPHPHARRFALDQCGFGGNAYPGRSKKADRRVYRAHMTVHFTSPMTLTTTLPDDIEA